MTLDIEHQFYNRGVIFNQLPNIILFHSKLFKTPSSYLRSMVNLSDNPLKIESDNHSLRMIRDSEAPDKYYKKLFGEKIFSFINDLSEKFNISSSGGWFFLESAIIGMKHSETEIPSSENVFLNFLLAHCEIEKTFIAQANDIDELEESIALLNTFAKKWLNLPSNFDFTKFMNDYECNNFTHDTAGFILAPLLYWAALYENYLSVFFESSENYEYEYRLNHYLPSFDEKKKVIYSNVTLLNRIKANWEKNKDGKHSWEEFYKDISRAQEIEIIDQKSLGYEQFAIDPNTTKIKQSFKRIRNGDKKITISFYIQNLRLLETDLYENYKDQSTHTTFKDYLSNIGQDPSAFLIVFIQLFDIIQRELIKQGFSEKSIIEQFARYPDYLKLVERRFAEFKITGAIKP